MIVRLVRMTFRPEEVEAFKKTFEEMAPKIIQFQGCSGVELLQDANKPEVMFTKSHWESEKHLNDYRYSELFQATWKKTKACFAADPEAWSTERIGGL